MSAALTEVEGRALAEALCRWHEPEEQWDGLCGACEAQVYESLKPAVERILTARIATAKAEALEEAAAVVEDVYILQCPVGPSSHYAPGARSAHIWWQTVLGGALDDINRRAATLRGERP